MKDPFTPIINSLRAQAHQKLSSNGVEFKDVVGLISKANILVGARDTWIAFATNLITDLEVD